MPNAHDLCRGHKRLLPLVKFALREGWEISRTAGGHLKFTKSGLPSIYTSATPSDHRASRNAKVPMRRIGRYLPGGQDG